MNLSNLWAQIEEDLAWRTDEIRFFQNHSSAIQDPAEQKQFRRSLILLLYAHFEGFCKFALTHYVTAVNSTGITCREACHAIAAASLSDIFTALRNPDSKCDAFRRDLPEDRALHRFARDREFIERVDEFGAKPVDIPDTIVNTESNLRPVVLRKNLYQLGFPHDQFSALEGGIQRLVNTRNSIAHGSLRYKDGVDKRSYDELREIVFDVMKTIKGDVMVALEGKRFLRPVTDDEAA